MLMVGFVDFEPLTLIGLLLVPLFVFLNGFFVAAEFGLVSIRKTRVEEMVNSKVAGALTVEKTIQNLDQTIAATQLGITLSSIALGFLGEPALAAIIHLGLGYFGWSIPLLSLHGVATVIAFSGVTFLHVVFGELIPKTLALRSPEKASLYTAGPMLLFGQIAKPFINLMNGTASLLIRLSGFEVVTGHSLAHSVEELKLVIEDTEEAGLIGAQEAEVLQNVFQLRSKKVSDCMIPKEKMSMLDMNLSLQQTLDAVREGGHTRMPVYEGDVNNIVGVVNTKDLLYLITSQGVALLQDALYPVIYLRPEDTIATALKLFRNNHRHLAVVRSSNGIVEGLITLEDIIEEIVGEIEDEQDQPDSSRMLRAFVRKKMHPKT